jgi:hypothetical protein
VTGRVVVAVVVGALVLAGPGLASVGAGQADGATAPADQQPADTSLLPDHGNNTTVHENPNEVDQAGDVDSLRRWLEGKMGSRLEDSAVELEQGDYERARSVVGDDYRDLLGKYVDVEGETQGDGAGDQFEETQEQQREFVDRVREYRETREAYEEAKANGNDQRARELGRELERQAENITETGRDLERAYEELENRSSVDTDRTRAAVGNVTENVSEQQAEIREETFVATSLSVSARPDAVSFLDPLVVDGRLVAANGSALEGRTVVLVAGDTRESATTDEDGRFSVRYRPTLASLGRQNVSVRYRPSGGALYLGATDVVSVSVEQVQPSVRIAGATDEVAYGDRLVVNGSVDVEGTGAEGVPVVVTLGDQRLGTTTTGAEGTFRFSGRVPASVADGERELSVRVPLEDQALASANASATRTVDATGTELRLDGVEIRADGLRVMGRLVTTDGRDVAGQRVGVQLAGTVLGGVESDDDGSFVGTFDVPGSVRPASGTNTLEVLAAFDGSETNLETSRATASVSVSALGGSNGGTTDGARVVAPIVGPVRVPMPWLVGAGVVVILVLAGAVVVGRRRGQGSVETDEFSSSGGGNSSAASTTDVDTKLLADADELVEEGATDAAVELAYDAVRTVVGDRLGVPEASTHWEFLQASDEAGLAEEGYVALAEVTERYESAAFAREAMSARGADSAVEAARTTISVVKEGA